MKDKGQPVHVAREGVLGPYRGTRFAVSFKWLVAGALLYALLLLVLLKGRPGDTIVPFLGPSFYLTPLFGLPLVLGTIHRPGRLRRIVYFFLLLPVVHMAAIYLTYFQALSTFDPIADEGGLFRALVSGAWGGALGSVLGFAGLWLVRLAPRRRAELATMGLFAILLTMLGAVGVGQALLLAGDDPAAAAHDSERVILALEMIHLPWQAAFAFALAWLMRPVRASRRSSVSDPVAEASGSREAAR